MRKTSGGLIGTLAGVAVALIIFGVCAIIISYLRDAAHTELIGATFYVLWIIFFGVLGLVGSPMIGIFAGGVAYDIFNSSS